MTISIFSSATLLPSDNPVLIARVTRINILLTLVKSYSSRPDQRGELNIQLPLLEAEIRSLRDEGTPQHQFFADHVEQEINTIAHGNRISL